jgi:hypothetical protein
MSELRACAVAARCVLRALPLFFREAPGTPLRVFCLMALDTVHVLRHSRPMPPKSVRELATFVDFQACTNAAVDHKELCATEYRTIRQRLAMAGLDSRTEEYLGRLRDLERHRPAIGGDRRRFEEARRYREAVVRLSLATLTAIALGAESLEDAIQATHSDADLDALYRIAMQFQVVDDVMDYPADLVAALPSFLTASASLSDAVTWTAGAARSYGERPGRSSFHASMPLRMALRAVTAATTLLLLVARLRHRKDRASQATLADARR